MTPLRRRIITIPLYVTLLVVALATLPVTLLLAATTDLIRRTPWGFSRSILFFSRRRALSTGSPFLSLISVKSLSLPLQGLWDPRGLHDRRSS